VNFLSHSQIYGGIFALWSGVILKNALPSAKKSIEYRKLEEIFQEIIKISIVFFY
jgi:hypothetical protein